MATVTKRPAKQSRRKKSVITLAELPPASEHITISITGPEHHVRRALTALRFDDEWNPGITVLIALDETEIADAVLSDELGGQKLHMFSQEARDDYKQRCMDEARRRGHPILRPDKIPAESDTAVSEVGDALHAWSKH